MRLSEATARAIEETAVRQFGPEVALWPIASRVRDAARGGDIDLLVARKRPPKSRARAVGEFAAASRWQLGDQRIDVASDD